MRLFWYKRVRNFGDEISPVIVGYFLKEKIEFADSNEQGKMLAIGSILSSLRENDVIWGSGMIKSRIQKMPAGARALAVRGPLTRARITGASVPEIYGDPAILLPLIYQPKIEKKYKVGYIPHYVDKIECRIRHDKDLKQDAILIDIQANWKMIINEIVSCEKIIASSLHAIIAAEAYGIPVVWAKYSDKIIGGQLKYQDYFLGTGRNKQAYGELPPLENLKEKQDILIKVLKKHYEKN